MNKQIDEMARFICNCYGDKGYCRIDGKPCDLECGSYKQAEAFYTAGYRKQEWISVEERLPDQEGEYLAYRRRGSIVLSYYLELDGVFGFERWDVTHWMPLPEAPKGEKTDA